jgi:hypothetical protein
MFSKRKQAQEFWLLYTGRVKKKKKKEFAENIYKLVTKKVKSENLHVQRYLKY